jgi:hypothetical protein
VLPENGKLVAKPGGTVKVDVARQQIEVRVPHRLWNPKRGTWRIGLGVGLWDKAAKRYLIPQAGADATHPGGGSGSSAAFFNVAFRTKEPVQKPTESTAVVLGPAWWRDRMQGTELAKGDMTPFMQTVSFGKLARRVTDNSGVPKTGAMDRILGSRFETAQGAKWETACFPSNEIDCTGAMLSRLQPYAIYIPAKPLPAAGYGLTLLMHSLSAMYNQYLGTRNMTQFGDRAGGSIVVTPSGRGPDGFYFNYGAADVFEVMNDVERRFKIDRSRAVATGYSMGGIGSFRLGSQFPDLFAKIQPTVGFEDNHDVLANEAFFMQTAQTLDGLGYRYELDAFQPCANSQCSPLFPNHLQLAINDWFAPAADFLDDATIDPDPAHVTYVVDGARNKPELQMVGDHAYWVSGLTLRDPAKNGPGGEPIGEIDAISHGRGVSEPASAAMPFATGTLSGGNMGDLSYTVQGRTWSQPPPGPASDGIDVTATNLATATIDVKRAGLTCDAKVNVKTDGPIAVTLAGCPGKTIKAS